MNVCMLTWEYPPRIVGGIARHCMGLSKALARRNCSVTVVTLEFPGSPSHEVIDGVEVHRVPIEIGHPSFMTWVFLFNHFLVKRVAELFRDAEFDVIHIHDWLVAPVGITAKHFQNKNLIITVHSTEMGRSQGLKSPGSYTIHSLEWWGTYESSRVIVTTEAMKEEVSSQFRLPLHKFDVIPNAIDVGKFGQSVDSEATRRSLGLSVEDEMILFVGRLTSQKGLEYLIDALPSIWRHHPNAHLVVVGDGWMMERLQEKARMIGSSKRVIFTRFIEDGYLISLLKSADVLVAPSVYEPFGIVTLEGMASGVPVVVSETGGLKEIIRHDWNGVLVSPRNTESIAWGVNKVLGDRDYAIHLVENALADVQARFDWDIVAEKTVNSYKHALSW